MSLRRLTTALFLLTVALNLAGCGGSGSKPGTAAGSGTAPAVTTQPANQAVTVGQTATFLVTAAGTAPLAYQWQKGTTPISGATSASYTTPATTTADNGTQFTVVVSNSVGSTTSNPATLTVSPVATATTDVLTYHNDVARTGQNLTETTLTTSNVTSAKFGKLDFYSVDGLVDAEPLYASSVSVPSNGIHNLLIVPTEHDSVYAFDADSGAKIWQITTLKTGETPSDNRSCGQVTPETESLSLGTEVLLKFVRIVISSPTSVNQNLTPTERGTPQRSVAVYSWLQLPHVTAG